MDTQAVCEDSHEMQEQQWDGSCKPKDVYNMQNTTQGHICKKPHNNIITY